MLRALLFIVALLCTLPAYAQSADYMGYLEQLININGYSPEQSPHNERSREVLSDRVIDKTNHVVGEVRDVFLNDQGEIMRLDADFNRLKIGTSRLVLDYKDMNIEPSGNGYKLGITDDQLIDMFPRLKALQKAYKPAQPLYALQSFQGAALNDTQGHKLGQVEDVLFDKLGGRADFLFVSLTYKTMSGRTLALPFDALFYAPGYKKPQITAPDALVQAMLEVAGRK